jgi:hypothetical protein
LLGIGNDPKTATISHDFEVADTAATGAGTH